MGNKSIPMAIRAVVFDIGGVLEITPPGGWRHRWEKTPGDLDRRLAPVWKAGSLGHISEAQAEEQIAELMGLGPVQREAFMADLWRDYLGELNRELADYFVALRQRCRTAILSNSFVGAREREQQTYALSDMSEFIIYSHEVGLEKPDPRIFQLTCQQLGLTPQEIAFVDDCPGHVEAARQLGIQAILHQDNARTIAQLEAFLHPQDPTRRFGRRVDDYVRYRPDYPPLILEFLEQAMGLHRDWTVADIGSGTGLLSRLFLEFGNRVVGVEPNQAMREMGQRQLAHYPQFRSLDGRAESTSLAPQSIDLIVAGQAFHWFQPEAARAEFQRISRAPHRVALIWNDRNHSTPLERGYHALMDEFASDYLQLRLHPSSPSALADFYGPDQVHCQLLSHHQHLDQQGLVGRVTSSSCAPLPGDPRYPLMVERLTQLYQEHQREGRVTLTYTTRLYWGTLDG